MHSHIIKDLLGFKGVIVQKTNVTNKFVSLYIKLERCLHQCPGCGEHTDKVHDYRVQTFKELAIFESPTFIHYKKRRYKCECCKKRFDENNDFIGRYQRISKRVIAAIVNALKSNYSMKSIAQTYFTSINTIIRILHALKYTKSKLPRVLSIDEFRGNSGGEKYQCILVDAENKTVYDILPKRTSADLDRYFKQFNNHNDVEFFVTDMWRPYRDLAKKHFPNATIIIDRFHYVRNAIWAMDNVRKRVQNEVSKAEYKFFKGSRRLLLAKPEKLRDDLKLKLAEVLMRNETIRRAYELKSCFMTFVNADNYILAHNLLTRFLNTAKEYNIPEFNKLAKTLKNWKSEILNSFKAPYSNGCTEGYNNKIKVIKRNAFGFKSFQRFRNRILHTCQ